MNKFTIQKYCKIKIISSNKVKHCISMTKTLESSMYSIVLNGHQPIQPPIFKVHFWQIFSVVVYLALSSITIYLILIKHTQTSFFSNIEWTRTCLSFGNRTRTPYFWLRMIEHQTSNIVRPITSILAILGITNSSLLCTSRPPLYLPIKVIDSSLKDQEIDTVWAR